MTSSVNTAVSTLPARSDVLVMKAFNSSTSRTVKVPLRTSHAHSAADVVAIDTKHRSSSNDVDVLIPVTFDLTQ